MADIQRWPRWSSDISAATLHGTHAPWDQVQLKIRARTTRSTLHVVEQPTELF
jgi:hypothetical protein